MCNNCQREDQSRKNTLLQMWLLGNHKQNCHQAPFGAKRFNGRLNNKIYIMTSISLVKKNALKIPVSCRNNLFYNFSSVCGHFGVCLNIIQGNSPIYKALKKIWGAGALVLLWDSKMEKRKCRDRKCE